MTMVMTNHLLATTCVMSQNATDAVMVITETALTGSVLTSTIKRYILLTRVLNRFYIQPFHKVFIAATWTRQGARHSSSEWGTSQTFNQPVYEALNANSQAQPRFRVRARTAIPLNNLSVLATVLVSWPPALASVSVHHERRSVFENSFRTEGKKAA